MITTLSAILFAVFCSFFALVIGCRIGSSLRKEVLERERASGWLEGCQYELARAKLRRDARGRYKQIKKQKEDADNGLAI